VTDGQVHVRWRKWRVATRDNLLRSLFRDDVWIPRERMEARCQKFRAILQPGVPCPDCPGKKCHCGFNSVNERSQVHRFGITRSPASVLAYTATPEYLTVIGQVSLWGRWWEHETGMRAQYAYPYSLVVLRPPIADHARAWDIARRAAVGVREHYLVDVDVE
jgi:hypothetical protein